MFPEKRNKIKELIFAGFIFAFSLIRPICAQVKLSENMDQMAEKERVFFSLRKVETLNQDVTDIAKNLTQWKGIFQELVNHPYAKDKKDPWNAYIQQSLHELELMENALKQSNKQTFWFHFDRLLEIKKKAHKEFKPGLLKVLKKLFKRRETL